MTTSALKVSSLVRYGRLYRAQGFLGLQRNKGAWLLPRPTALDVVENHAAARTSVGAFGRQRGDRSGAADATPPQRFPPDAPRWAPPEGRRPADGPVLSSDCRLTKWARRSHRPKPAFRKVILDGDRRSDGRYLEISASSCAEGATWTGGGHRPMVLDRLLRQRLVPMCPGVILDRTSSSAVLRTRGAGTSAHQQARPRRR